MLIDITRNKKKRSPKHFTYLGTKIFFSFHFIPFYSIFHGYFAIIYHQKQPYIPSLIPFYSVLFHFIPFYSISFHFVLLSTGSSLFSLFLSLLFFLIREKGGGQKYETWWLIYRFWRVCLERRSEKAIALPRVKKKNSLYSLFLMLWTRYDFGFVSTGSSHRDKTRFQLQSAHTERVNVNIFYVD